MIYITGASGFTGSHLVPYLLSGGHKIRCLVRTEKAGQVLSKQGAEVVPGDVNIQESLHGTIKPGDFVLHLVGIIEEKGNATFRNIHVEGTSHVVNEAKRAGADHFFFQSALGADINSWSSYLKTKAEAEDIVKTSGLRYTIFRPSLIIGPWDGFTKKLVDMINISPFLPIPGSGKTLFQPIYVKDWLKCIGKVIQSPERFRSTYEIGGPEHLSYRTIIETLASAMGKNKPGLPIPMGLLRFGATVLERLPLPKPVTNDQLRLLETNNITDPAAVENHFGFSPVRYSEALKDFF